MFQMNLPSSFLRKSPGRQRLSGGPLSSSEPEALLSAAGQLETQGSGACMSLPGLL